MKYDRLFGLLLTAIATIFPIYASHRYVLSLFFLSIAFVGYLGQWQLDLSRIRRIIAFLFVVLILTLHYRLVTPLTNSLDTMVSEMERILIAEYLIGIMALQFFLKVKKETFATIAMVGLTSILITAFAIKNSLVFQQLQIFGIPYLVLMIFCGNFTRIPTLYHHYRQLLVHHSVALTILILSVGLGWFTGSFWQKNQRQFYNFLLNTNTSPVLMDLLGYNNDETLGFADEVQLDSIHNIKTNDSDKIVLHIFSQSEPGYVRAKIYETYQNDEWISESIPIVVTPTVTIPENIELPKKSNIFRLQKDQLHTHAQSQTMDIWPDADLEVGFLNVLGSTIIEAPVSTIRINDNAEFDSDDLVGGVNYFIAKSDIRQDKIPSQATFEKYLKKPFYLNDSLAPLAKSIFKNTKTPKEKISAVKKYFHENYQYRLGIEIPEHEDPLEYFLLEQPAAHCEFFASGAAVLLRYADVPTRLVTGMITKERHPYLDCWVSRNKDAHAWVEAWDSEDQKWVLVEATVSEGQPGDMIAQQGGFVIDMIQFYFQKIRIMIFRGEYIILLQWILSGLLAILGFLVTNPLGILISILLLWMMLKKYKHIFKRKPKSESELLKLCHKMLKKMDRNLKRKGIWRSSSETLAQFSHRLSANHEDEYLNRVSEWYQKYAHVRYGAIHNIEKIIELEKSFPRK